MRPNDLPSFHKMLRGIYADSKLVLDEDNLGPGRILVCGATPEYGEVKPFTINPNSIIRQSMALIRAIPSTYRFTYLLKNGSAPVSSWISLLHEEIEIGKSPALILLGSTVAQYVLQLTGDHTVEVLRRKRFISPRFRCPAFVTYGPLELDNKDTKVAREVHKTLMSDLTAVFAVNEKYFPDIVKVK